MSAKQPNTGAEPAPNESTGQPEQPTGPELARAVLDAARANRPTPARRKQRRGASGRTGGYSGVGPDQRDPAMFGALIGRLVAERGWQQPAAEGTLFGSWERLVGTDIAAKCRPITLRDGELTIEAVSTAWATQLRMFSRTILGKIARELGDQLVRRLHIHGPAAPSWRRGPLTVPGRGPRDTYG